LKELSIGIGRTIPSISNGTPPAPILPKSLKKLKFMDIDPLEMARQLTILEWKEFHRIAPVEFANKAWSQKENSIAVNVKSMISTSNIITGWVAESILFERDIKKRSSVIKHWISIAEVTIN